MINDQQLKEALDPLFAGYPQTDDLIDLYDEVKTDVREHAQDLLDGGQAENERAAIKTAITDLGDLSEPLSLITATPEPTIINEAIQSAVVDQTITTKITHLVLDAGYGNVRLTPSTDQFIHIRQFQRPRTVAGKLQINLVEDTLRLEVPAPSWLDYLIPFRHPTSRVEISLPQPFTGDLDLMLESGSLTTRDLNHNGDLTLDLKSGSATLSRCHFAQLKGQLSSGSVKIDQLTADQLTLTAHSGAIKMNNTQANFDISAQSGSIKGTDLSGHGRFLAHSGIINLHWLAITGDVYLETHSGTIQTQHPAADAFKFNLQAHSGTIKVNRPATFDLQVQGAAIGTTSPDATHEIKAVANAGTIKLN